MVEPDNEPEPQEVPEEEPSSKDVRPTQDDLQRQLAEIRRQAEIFRSEAERGREWQQLARQVVEQSVRPVQPVEPETEPEIDPQVRLYLDKKLQAYMGEIGQVYQRDRLQDLSYRAQLEKERAATRLVGFQDLSGEIDQLMNALPPDSRSAPGAYEEAYYLVLGRKAAEMLRNQGSAPVGVSTSLRSPAQVSAPALSSDERAFIQKTFRGKVDEGDIDFLSQREFSVEDFNRHAERRAKSGGRKR